MFSLFSRSPSVHCFSPVLIIRFDKCSGNVLLVKLKGKTAKRRQCNKSKFIAHTPAFMYMSAYVHCGKVFGLS